MFEFLVDSISPEGLVLGNGERDIPLGTTFTAVRLSRVHRGPGEYRTEDLGEVGSVAPTSARYTGISGRSRLFPAGIRLGCGWWATG